MPQMASRAGLSPSAIVCGEAAAAGRLGGATANFGRGMAAVSHFLPKFVPTNQRKPKRIMIQTLLIGGLGTPEILVIALIVLLLFGGKKIPELMKGVGKGINSFKKGLNETDEEIKKDISVSDEKDGKEVK